MPGRRFASLTSRLVVTLVTAVALLSLAVGALTTLAMRGYLTDQLDDKVRSSLRREAPPDRVPGSGAFDPGSGATDDGGAFPAPRGNQGPGTLLYSSDSRFDGGVVLTADRAAPRRLSSAAVAVLERVPTDGAVHQVDLPAFGTYRVVAVVDSGGDLQVVGLPTADVQAAVTSLVGYELLLAVLAAALAGGAGTVVVRRQMRPLRELAGTAHDVAALPLASSTVDLAGRVPAHLVDEATEVGQVGHALDTLLAHVGTSLAARERSEAQVRQFVADASHELRTPLATIKGYAELARRRPDDLDAVRTALAKVEAESGRMTTLVEDLLLLARLDAGRPLEREPVDLTLLLLEAVSDARVLAPDHRWRLELPEEAVEVVGDGQRLHQVVTNLLTNARKYTPPGTTVTVTAHPDGFTVHDDGPGFPPGLVDVAFERFVRGDVARTRGPSGPGGVEGAGLGLALVHAIVTAHGGHAEIRSRPGDTTTTITQLEEIAR